MNEHERLHSDNTFEDFMKKNADLAEEDKNKLLQLLGYCLMLLHNGQFDQLLPSEISVITIFFPNATLDKISSANKLQADIRSLANFYCNILTNGKITKYSETLTERDYECFFSDEARDVIKKMANGRITIEEVMQHPFHWNEQEKLVFLCRAFDYINAKHEDLEDDKKKGVILEKYGMGDRVDIVSAEGWIEKLKLDKREISQQHKLPGQHHAKLERTLIYELAPRPKKSGEEIGMSVYELLRFIRNRDLELPKAQENVKNCFGIYPTGFLTFFTSRFPRLLTHVYNNMKPFVNQETMLAFQFDPRKRPYAEELISKLKLETEKFVLVKGTHIMYNPKRCLRIGSKVFEAMMGGVIPQKIVIKFITDYNEKNEREIKHLIDAEGSKHVVKYIDSNFCEYNDQKAIYIAMERCESKTLSEQIENRQPVSYETRKEYVRSIAKGLQHLKEKNILHRDLKPNNILFRNDSPVISDFGLSKKLSENKSRTVQSMSNVGTNGWRAPETSGENCVTSHKTDIYSAGLVFFFVLTNGAHPYGGNKEHWQTLIDLDEDGTKCILEALYATPDGSIAIDLIASMLRRDPKSRSSIEAVLKHPFFFDTEKRLKFLTRAHASVHEGCTPINLNSLGNEKYGRKVEDEIKNWNAPVREDGAAEEKKESGKLQFTSEEMTMIESNFKQKGFEVNVDKNAMVKKAKNYADSLTGLLRLIRNRDAHHTQDEAEKIICMTRDQFLKFFSDRFTHLFIYVYYRFKHYYFPEDGNAKDIPDTMTVYF